MHDMKNNRREINKTRLESLPLQDVAEDVVVIGAAGFITVIGEAVTEMKRMHKFFLISAETVKKLSNLFDFVHL